MEPAGAERHRRSPEAKLDGWRANQSNRRVEGKPPLSNEPERYMRRGRESNPRIAVLQTATLPLGYPANLRERTISLSRRLYQAPNVEDRRSPRLTPPQLFPRFNASINPIIVTA